MIIITLFIVFFAFDFHCNNRSYMKPSRHSTYLQSRIAFLNAHENEHSIDIVASIDNKIRAVRDKNYFITSTYGSTVANKLILLDVWCKLISEGPRYKKNRL